MWEESSKKLLFSEDRVIKIQVNQNEKKEKFSWQNMINQLERCIQEMTEVIFCVHRKILPTIYVVVRFSL